MNNGFTSLLNEVSDGGTHLLTQYADDTTIFVEDAQSAKEMFRIIQLFSEVSG